MMPRTMALISGWVSARDSDGVSDFTGRALDGVGSCLRGLDSGPALEGRDIDFGFGEIIA
jgi:hypothetical protein